MRDLANGHIDIIKGSQMIKCGEVDNYYRLTGDKTCVFPLLLSVKTIKIRSARKRNVREGHVCFMRVP